MARPNIEKRGRKTPTSKTTSRVAKPSIFRVTRSETLRRAAMALHNSNSPLLRLPAEIRNQIYDYVIGGQSYMIHETSVEKPSYYLIRKLGMGLHWREQTALSRTCRQFRHDTSLLFFQNNIFSPNHIESPSAMNRWMHSLQPQHANAIQTIMWGFWGLRSDLEDLKLLLAEWVRIKGIGLYCYSISSGTVPTQEALKIAGFEPDGTVEAVKVGLSIVWYERSSPAHQHVASPCHAC